MNAFHHHRHTDLRRSFLSTFLCTPHSHLNTFGNMTTLQPPSHSRSQILRLFNQDDPRCPSPTMSFADLDMQDCSKKTMQTTVAIRDEDPHHFKIRPLKQVPLEERPTASPYMNFDRPFVAPRLGLPTLYQLAPQRTASAYSFNSIHSIKDEHPSVVSLTLLFHIHH